MNTSELTLVDSRRADFEAGTSPLAGVARSLVVSRETCPAGAEYPAQTVSAFTLLLTEGGEATTQAVGKSLTHGSGSLMLINAGTEIRERVGPQQPWRVVYLMLSGPWADLQEERLRERSRGIAAYHPAPVQWQQQIRALVDIGFEQGEGWAWPFLSGCAALFGSISRYPAAAGGPDRLLDDIEALLDADSGRAWSVSELARLLKLTPRQLDYRFQKITGEPVARWIRRRRIAAAQRLLGTGHSVVQTADSLGFATPYHFSRVFKSLAGQPPSQARAEAQANRRHPSPASPSG